VASAGGHTATTAANPNTFDQDFIDFARCMRDHGIANFPDPVHRPGHQGLSLSFPDGFDPNSGPGKVANDACQSIIQPVIDMKDRGARSSLTPARLEGLLAYARCMRQHQIPLLDPDPQDGHISVGNVPGLSQPARGREDPTFAAADRACRHLLPAGTPDDGTGPA
jgi:hypothetical protein